MGQDAAAEAEHGSGDSVGAPAARGTSAAGRCESRLVRKKMDVERVIAVGLQAVAQSEKKNNSK